MIGTTRTVVPTPPQRSLVGEMETMRFGQGVHLLTGQSGLPAVGDQRAETTERLIQTLT
jgi:hypothetical protein